VRGRATAIRHRVNINTLEPEAAASLHMNDIAAIELETSGPLFFDSYERNRTTGSFIVIDPLTNATLAAGMIRENLSESSRVSAEEQILHSQTPITPLERHQRHGHYPAIILVNARASLAGRLERALFDGGFEAIVVEENSSTPTTKHVWRALHAAGLVVIYHNPSLGAEERLDLQSAATDYFFDLAEVELPAADAEAVERVFMLLEPLRIPSRQGKSERVN